MSSPEEMMRGCAYAIEAAYTVHLWNEFYDEVCHKNRFFPKSDFVEKYIYPLADKKYRSTISQETFPFYRARLITPGDYKDMKFDDQIQGFDSDHSGAPTDELASSGRANPAGVPYLYLASSPETACSEVCPFPTQLISVAEFKLQRDVSVVNLHQFDLKEDDELKRSGLYTAMQEIMWSFMRPNDAKNDTEYAPSQYIAAYLASKGIDGVKYASSHNPTASSFNLVLFNKTVAKCLSDRGTVYRCSGEKKIFQNMTTGLADTEKVLSSGRQWAALTDEDIKEIRSRMSKHISGDSAK